MILTVSSEVVVVLAEWVETFDNKCGNIEPSGTAAEAEPVVTIGGTSWEC